jgi:hypothetical protein
MFACPSVLNAIHIILSVLLFIIHRGWSVGSCLRQMCGIFFPLNTQRVLRTALASVALLTTRR